MWQQPKTNWTNTDKYTAADYNRQIGNIKHIADEVLPEMGYVATVDAGEPVDRATKPVKDVWNRLEAGLAAIEVSGVPLQYL